MFPLITPVLIESLVRRGYFHAAKHRFNFHQAVKVGLHGRQAANLRGFCASVNP